jgi:Family of unknown function (DUF6499)
MPNVQNRFLDHLDFADFAQEFLRRNPQYRRQYRQIIEDGVLDTAADRCAAMANSWGLHFPVSA